VLVLLTALLAGGCAGPKSPPPVVDEQALSRAGIVIADNAIYRNNRSGIQVRGDSPVKISACNIHQNGRAGINLDTAVNAMVEDSNLHANGTGGITADNPNQVMVRNCLLHGNRRAGIRIRKNDPRATGASTAELRGNKIFDNNRGGVHAIADGPTPIVIAVRDNRVYGNREAGVRVEDNVHLTAADNVFSGNGTSGLASYITADQSPVLDIYQNRIAFNRAAGIFVHSGVTGAIGISNNLIYNNYLSGISCGLWDGPEDETVNVRIYHNTIVANGGNGEGSGIRNLSSGTVMVRNNIIAYNLASGINTGFCSGMTNNLLFANGTTVASPDNGEPLPFLTEKEQYAGCSGRQWGDVLADPLFTDPERYDFRLQPESPAVGEAASVNSDYFSKQPNPDLGADPLLVPAALPEGP
jgi:hypothetical protein